MSRRALHLLISATLLSACQLGTPASTEAPRSAPSPTPGLAARTPSPTERPTPSPSPAPTATPATPSPTPTPIPPATAFALNLYTDGDFVPQHTFEWCVGASIQMAYNLVAADVRNSFEDQQALWEMARARSSNSFNGANPRGWAATLTEIGIGPYELVSIPEYDAALRTAAAAIRDTGRPVGLVMWRGRHAWVMSGFESLGDPARTDDFRVTGIRVLDPLFPHGSSLWGPSPSPNSLLTPGQLATDFVVRDRRNWSMDVTPGYFLVLPT